MTSIAEIDGVRWEPRWDAGLQSLIKQIDGRLFPLGFLRLLWGRRKLKRIRMLSTNVTPEYQRWVWAGLVEPDLAGSHQVGIEIVNFHGFWRATTCRVPRWSARGAAHQDLSRVRLSAFVTSPGSGSRRGIGCDAEHWRSEVTHGGSGRSCHHWGGRGQPDRRGRARFLAGVARAAERSWSVAAHGFRASPLSFRRRDPRLRAQAIHHASQEPQGHVP